MIKHLIVTCVMSFLVKPYRADDLYEGAGDMADQLIEKETNEFNQDDILKYIGLFEETASQVRRAQQMDTSLDSSDNLYDEMTAIVQAIIDLNINSNNVYKFLRAKGLDRIVASNLIIPYTPLRRQLLILTKQLLDIAPITAKSVIPISILDNLLDIFENDQNLALKAYALDILYLWLPGSPKLQARVMKLKGLDPFYHQISNLDITVIHTLLELFNKILDEHITARNKDIEKTRVNAEDLVLYQRIGLLERLSTAHVCNGLLNIFETSLPFVPSTGQIISSMFELVKKIKPFCMNVYKGKSKPLEVFSELFQFVANPSNGQEFKKHGINVTDIYQVLEKYIEELKYVMRKDEL